MQWESAGRKESGPLVAADSERGGAGAEHDGEVEEGASGAGRRRLSSGTREVKAFEAATESSAAERRSGPDRDRSESPAVDQAQHPAVAALRSSTSSGAAGGKRGGGLTRQDQSSGTMPPSPIAEDGGGFQIDPNV